MHARKTTVHSPVVPADTYKVARSLRRTVYLDDYYGDYGRRSAEFLSFLHALPYYRQGLLYSGIDLVSGIIHSQIWCSSEEFLSRMGSVSDHNPLEYALDIREVPAVKPCIIVLDPLYIRANAIDRYVIQDACAFVAIISLKEKR